MTNKIQVSVPYVAEQSKRNVATVLGGNWLSPNGSFSEQFADMLGREMIGKAVLTNSGTSARLRGGRHQGGIHPHLL